jgi:hypothetical protein
MFLNAHGHRRHQASSADGGIESKGFLKFCSEP